MLLFKTGVSDSGVKKYTVLAHTTLHNLLLLTSHLHNCRNRRFCENSEDPISGTVRNISIEFIERINVIILDHDEGALLLSVISIMTATAILNFKNLERKETKYE